MLRRCAAMVLAAVWIASTVGGLALEVPQVDVSAASCVLYDPWLETVIYERGGFTRRGMASTTKIMTAALALELYDPAALVTIEPQWCGAEGSSMYLKAGEQMTIADLLYGLMLMSGNDAAVALASIYSGEPEDFVALMNQKAQALGLADTAFQNPNGLDGAEHFSTAYDMARLAAWAMENPAFGEIVGTRTTERAGRYMKNHNKLLASLPGCTGIKTGYTKSSGRCLVTSCTREGRTLMAVTLNGPDDWRDHTSLYSAAFEDVQHRQLVQVGPVGSVHMANAGMAVQLAVYEDFGAALSEAEVAQVRLELVGPRMWYGSALEGERWGSLRIVLGDRTLEQVPVYFSQTVEVQPDAGLLDRLRQVVLGLFNNNYCVST